MRKIKEQTAADLFVRFVTYSAAGFVVGSLVPLLERVMA